MDKHYADLHIHTTASDGTLAPGEVVDLAYREGLSVISITDHDTVAGVTQAMSCLPRGLTLVPGVEFSCLYEGGQGFLMHLLGYGIDPCHPAILTAVDIAKEARLQKHARRLEYFKERYGIEFTKDEHHYLNTRPNVGRLHIARLLIDRGLCFTVREGIDIFMSSPDFPDGTIPLGKAVNAIISAGGIPIYAHSLGGECEVHLSFEETLSRIKLIKAVGVMGLECYYSRYSREEIDFLLSVAAKEGLLVSGGSDFHGKNKTVRIGDTSIDGSRVESSKLSLLAKIISDA